MRRYLLLRLVWAGPIVLSILTINFLVIHLVPGDPVQALVGDFPTPPGYVEAVRHEFGLDQSLGTQLWRYLANLAQGDLGFSFANRQPVLTVIAARSRLTLLLMLPALAAAAIIGVVLAVFAARRPGGALDGSLTALSLFGYSVPIFWLGQILIVVFAVWLQWLPAQGMTSLRESPTGVAAVLDVAWHLVLPAFSVTIYYVAVVARVARAAMLDALQQDFVLTARSKGLSSKRVLWRHVLPNALIPVVTVVGYNFGASLTGAIFVESVFAWPGLGNLFMTSIANRDYPVLQGIFLVTSLSVVLANLMTDLLYGVIDPRVRGDAPSHG